MRLDQFFIRLALVRQGRWAADEPGNSAADTLKKAIADKVREKLAQKSNALVEAGPQQFAVTQAADVEVAELPEDFDLDSFDLDEVITEENVGEVAAVVQRIADDIVKQVEGEEPTEEDEEETGQKQDKDDTGILDALEESNDLLRQQNEALQQVVDLMLKSAKPPEVEAETTREAVDKLANRYIHVARMLLAAAPPKGKWEPVREEGAKSRWKYIVDGKPVAYSQEKQKPERPPEAPEEVAKPGEPSRPEDVKKPAPSRPKEEKTEPAPEERAKADPAFKTHNTGASKQTFMDRLLYAMPAFGGKGYLSFEEDDEDLAQLRQDIKDNPAYEGWKEKTVRDEVRISPPMKQYTKVQGGIDYETVLAQGVQKRQEREQEEQKQLEEAPLGGAKRQEPEEGVIEKPRPGGEAPPTPESGKPGPAPQQKRPGKSPQEPLLDLGETQPGEPTAPLPDDEPLLDFGKTDKPEDEKEEGVKLEDIDEGELKLEDEEDEEDELRTPTLEEVLEDPSKMKLEPKAPGFQPLEKKKGVTPDWYDPEDPIDPRTEEGRDKMEDRGFIQGSMLDKEGKAVESIPPTTVVYNVFDGKSYTFDELPKEVQDEMNKLQQEGTLNIAPPMAPDEIPKELLNKVKQAMERARKKSGKAAKKAKKPSALTQTFSKIIGKTGQGAKELYSFATSQLQKSKMLGRKTRDFVGSMFKDYFNARRDSVRPQPLAPAKSASIVARVYCAAMAERVACAELHRLAVKDKDLMSDTGGKTKGRQRDPKDKPPREDLKVRWRKRRLRPSDMDPDTQCDPDIDGDPDMRAD